MNKMLENRKKPKFYRHKRRKPSLSSPIEPPQGKGKQYPEFFTDDEGRVRGPTTPLTPAQKAWETRRKRQQAKVPQMVKHYSHIKKDILEIARDQEIDPRTLEELNPVYKKYGKENVLKVFAELDLEGGWLGKTFGGYRTLSYKGKDFLKDLETEPQKRVQTPRVRATYNRATGWMAVQFDEKPSEDVRASLKQEGFRWRPRRKQWVAKWTADREDLAKKLAGKVETVDIKPQYAKTAKRARELQQKHLEEAQEHSKKFDSLSGVLPFGQPILVGHHSEKRHRNLLKKIDRELEKAVEEREIAEKYGEKAERYEKLAVKGENPVTIYNRIQRLEADERGWLRQLEEADLARKAPKLAERFGWTVDAKHEDYCRRNLEKVRTQLSVQREKYKRSGGIPAEHMALNKGDVIETSWGEATILKVNPKTIKVEYHEPHLKMMSGQNIDKTDIVKKVPKAKSQPASLRTKLWRTSIGHYGGRFVSVPAEHFEQFKKAFPPRVFPRKVERKNVAQTLTEQGEKRFNEQFSHSQGVYYELYFAHGSKGIDHLDKIVGYYGD